MEIIASPKLSGKYISQVAENVKIDEVGIDKCVDEILQRLQDGRLSLDLKLYKDAGEHPTKVRDEDVDWVFLTSALNFSFWNLPSQKPYLVTYRGKTQNGYMSMCAAINRTLDEGITLTKSEFYGKISSIELNKYFMGDDQISCPMIDERVACLHEISRVLLAKYDGKFVNCLKKCDLSAMKLLQMVTEDFPCFNDAVVYKGKKVSLHKRAQILVADLWQLFEGKGLCNFHDIDEITMFADYRVPQSLQYFGAFQYKKELLDFLKSEQLLKSGDPREVEIRGCSIEAVEQIVSKVNAKGVKVNATQIDNFLWSFRREKSKEMEQFPFHKVRSIYY